MPRPCLLKPGDATVSDVEEGRAAEASTPRPYTQRSVSFSDDKADLLELLGGTASQGLQPPQGQSSPWGSEREDQGGEAGGAKPKCVIARDVNSLLEEREQRCSTVLSNDSGVTLDGTRSYMTEEERLMDVPSLLKKRTMDASEIFRETDHSYVDLLMAALSTTQDFLVRRTTIELRHSAGIHAICYRASTNVLFMGFFGVILGVNIILLAFEADANAHRALYPEEDAFAGFISFQAVSEHIFTTLFLLEILIRLIGCPQKPWHDGWLVADGFIVFLSILDVWILAIVAQADCNMASLSIFRVARILRAVRALRAVRFFRYVQALRIVAEAMGEALRHTFWLIIVAFSLNWCMAVLLVSSVDIWDVSDWDPADPLDWQASQEVPYIIFQYMSAFLTVLELVMVEGIPWGSRILRPLFFNHQLTYKCLGVVLLGFICVSILWLANVIRGIYIYSLIKAVEQDNSFLWEKSLLTGDVSVTELKRYFAKFDYDRIGMLRACDFKKGIEEYPKFCTCLGIKPHSCEALFRQLDGNRDGFVGLDEFLIGCLKLTGKPKALDMIIQDHNHVKMAANLYLLGVRYDRDFKLTKHNINNVDHKLNSLQLSAQKLIKEVVNEDEEHDSRIRSFMRSHNHMEKSLGNQILIALEERYSFRKRFDALTDHTKAAAKELVDCANSSEENLERNMLTVIKGVWQDVLYQEALPWVRERLMVAHATVPTNIPPDHEPGKDLPSTTSGWMIRKSMLKRIDHGSVLYSSKPLIPVTMSL